MLYHISLSRIEPTSYMKTILSAYHIHTVHGTFLATLLWFGLKRGGTPGGPCFHNYEGKKIRGLQLFATILGHINITDEESAVFICGLFLTVGSMDMVGRLDEKNPSLDAAFNVSNGKIFNHS